MNAAPPDRDLAAVQWLTSFINFERLAAGAPFARPEYSLEPFRALLRRLGDPQDARPTIHVAGTKGKGSVALLLDRLARAAGLRTVRYTSPHLVSFRERIAIDDAPIDAAAFERLFAGLRVVVESDGAAAPERAFRSLFELMTAGAWVAAREWCADLVLLETGLGGRLDATNCVARPRAAVVASIGYDHTKILGETIDAIAREKAGIFKPGCPAVVRRQEHDEAPAILATLEEAGRRAGAPVVRAWEAWRVAGPRAGSARGLGAPGRVDVARGGRALGTWPFGLAGAHQAGNLEVALAAFEAAGCGPDDDAAWCDLLTRADLGALRHPGRLEVVRTDPPIVVDGAHCPLSLRAVFAVSGRSRGARSWSVGLGLLGHKEHERIGRVLGAQGSVRRWWPIELDDPRAWPGANIRHLLEVEAALGERVAAPPQAPDAAGRIARLMEEWVAARLPDEALLLTGSLFLVAPTREAARRVFGEGRAGAAEVEGASGTATDAE